MRDKAKVVLVLMEDDEKLKEEREFAVKTREKTSKSAAGKPFFLYHCYILLFQQVFFTDHLYSFAYFLTSIIYGQRQGSKL